MKCLFRKNLLSAFSLIETVTALIILAIISSSVFVVINRCMSSVADSALRMQAFEVSRKNMETLLVKDSVTEMVEYGSSDKYPEIQWQTTVETFYEPITERMWIQAVCSAEYTDTAGELQKVELTHWLTDLTKEQLIKIIEQRQEDLTAEQIIEAKEEAADYADVDVETIELWEENGMLTTKDGYYIKSVLDLYKQTNGKPTAEDRNQMAKEVADLEEARDRQDEKDEQDELEKPDKPDNQNYNYVCGYTVEELRQMDSGQVWKILSNCDEFIAAGGRL
jgi:Tfp pilus assembly protein PilV